jgi:hypothetical protein
MLLLALSITVSSIKGRMEDTNRILDLADWLAEFSNLEPASVEEFRKKRAGFVPDFWWNESVTSGIPLPDSTSKIENVAGLEGYAAVKIWQACQATVQEAWKSGTGKRAFPLTACIRLISAGVRPDLPTEGRDYQSEPLAEPLIHAANAVVIPREQAAIYHINVESDLWLAGTRVWPYQEAVMFLSTNPWRALFCGLCGKRFVADKPGRRFCSEGCTREARNRGKLAWWNEHGGEQRRAKDSKKRKAKEK